ncbi:MAG: long-chain fatty acid--CoA ligase [Gemmatimonadetes bacterium]|nr:long-chain fatty acid--CoA ligase [Gemmatimonadota bacterium]
MIAQGGPRPAPGTLNHLFFDAMAAYDRPNAMNVRVAAGQWQGISHRDTERRVRQLSFGLLELGFRPGDRLALISENRPEWALTDWACLAARLADVPLYPSLPAEQLVHPLNDSGAVAVFVSGETHGAKIAAIRAQCPALQHVITFSASLCTGADLTLAEVEARGAAVDTPERAAKWKRDALAVGPNELATLIYTSGTTGLPKGVMLSHDNIYSNVQASMQVLPLHIGEEVALSFLPLCHIFERMGDYLYWAMGAAIHYVDSFDTVPIALQEARPTFAMSVPRLYEKMYARAFENALASGAVKKRIFFWARAVGERWADAVLAGNRPHGPLAWQYALARKLVFSKITARTGGRIRFFVSGGAPLSPDINKFFFAAGLTILEGYGLTETSPVIGVNSPTAFRIGTIGKPINGVEVMIASDGEVLTRGPHVMQGYWNRADATAEAIDSEGWFHTGDIGVLEDGFLRITDRKKDIIVTAGGKNIAPQNIENGFKTNKYVSQAVMIGDKRKYPIVLIVPEFAALERWAALHNVLWSERTQLLQMPTIQKKMEKEIAEECERMKLASFETPKKVGLLVNDFTVDRGELTPTLKVKRRVIDKTYAALIDSLYAGNGE